MSAYVGSLKNLKDLKDFQIRNHANSPQAGPGSSLDALRGVVGFCQLPWLRDTAVRQAWGPGGACCGTGRLRAEVVRPLLVGKLVPGLRGEPAGGAYRLASVASLPAAPAGWTAGQEPLCAAPPRSPQDGLPVEPLMVKQGARN